MCLRICFANFIKSIKKSRMRKQINNPTSWFSSSIAPESPPETRREMTTGIMTLTKLPGSKIHLMMSQTLENDGFEDILEDEER